MKIRKFGTGALSSGREGVPPRPRNADDPERMSEYELK
jgi:hypothetical protein